MPAADERGLLDGEVAPDALAARAERQDGARRSAERQVVRADHLHIREVVRLAVHERPEAGLRGHGEAAPRHGPAGGAPQLRIEARADPAERASAKEPEEG